MTDTGIKGKQPVPYGCVVSLGITALTLMLMFSTVDYGHHPTNVDQDGLLACSGRFGVGLPVPFLCDYSSGSSPGPSSWDRIDPSDFPYISPPRRGPPEKYQVGHPARSGLCHRFLFGCTGIAGEALAH